MSINAGQDTITKDTISGAYNQIVVDWINQNYPILYTDTSKPFTDFPTDDTEGVTIFFPSPTVGSVPPIGTTNTDSTYRSSYDKITNGQLIDAQIIRDAFFSYTNVEVSRYRRYSWKRNVTASGTNADGTTVATSSETRTGISARLGTKYRSSLSSIDTSSGVSQNSTALSTSVTSLFTTLRDRWLAASVNTTPTFNYSVCHNSCHSNCHGSRGRR